MGNAPEGTREDAAAPERFTGDDMQRTLLALIFLLLAASTCPAGQHPVTVTRTSDDFYAAFDRDILIKTRFCSVRAFQESALLSSDRFGELVFTNGTRCTVDTVYARKRLRRGTHKVTVTREGEGVYRLAGSESCSLRHAARRWPCGTRPYWRCRTAFPACCTCMVEPAGWRAFSRPSLIDIGPRPGLDDPRVRWPGLPGFSFWLRVFPAGGWAA